MINKIFIFTFLKELSKNDGPSAGVTLTTAIYSAFTNKPVRDDVAMTGEITLRGNVLPIGGLKRKIPISAHRSGIRKIHHS